MTKERIRNVKFQGKPGKLIFKILSLELYFFVPVGADGNDGKRECLDSQCRDDA